MRHLILIAFLLAIFGGCSSNITDPTPPREIPAPAPAPELPEQVVARPEPAVEPDGEKVANVNRDGSVTIRPPGRAWTACVYNTAQELQHLFRVFSGTTPFDNGELCGTVTVQIDVQEGLVCPSSGYDEFDGFKAGRILTLALDPCTEPTPPPCEPKVEEWRCRQLPQGAPGPTQPRCALYRETLTCENETIAEWGESCECPNTCPEDTEPEIIYGPWSSWQDVPVVNNGEEEPVCIEEFEVEQFRTRKVFEQLCNLPLTFIGLETEFRTIIREREVDCPEEPKCVIPAEGLTLSWSGPGDPHTECSAFGPYTDGTPADFWLCKAGSDRIVSYFDPSGDEVCPNGKELSHVTSCVCDVAAR